MSKSISTKKIKKEPKLANPGHARSLSTVPAYDFPPCPPKNIPPNKQLSLSSGKATNSEMAELSRSHHSAYHPSIHSIFNQTSRRISEFTSRLNGPSLSSQSSILPRHPPPESLPPTPRSPVMFSSNQCDNVPTKPEAVPRHSLAPLQRTPHHQEDIPPIIQTLLPTDNPPVLSKVKRSNARVHSPNFYQSLKSRWRPDLLPAQDIFATLSSPSLTSKNPPNLIGDFQTPETSEVVNFVEPSPSRSATEIVEDSEEKDAGHTGSDSNPPGQPGELSSRTVQTAPASSSTDPAASISQLDSDSGSTSKGPQCSTVTPTTSNTIDQVQPPTSEASKPQPMTIAEGLHHKHHLNFAARRSSISMVLKRPDSLDASTPILFQGIWEKELEENERKWKRLARMSGSQSSSRYSTESYTGNDSASKTHGERVSHDGGPSRHSSSITSEHLIRLGRKLSQNKAAHHTKSRSQSDVLDQVWDSFKSEAELSLSDISCDRSIIDSSSGSPDCQSGLPALHQITFNDQFQRAHTVQGCESLAREDAKPIGLGLFHSCEPSTEGAFPIKDEYSPITNAKLKKLSLLAMRDSAGAAPSLPMRGRRRRPVNIISPEIPDTNQLEINPALLDLSLLDAFPAPPRSHRSSQSSSSSHSLKARKSTDLRNGQRDGAATPAPAFDASNVLPSPPSKDPYSHQRQKSLTENSKTGPISFTLTSFSNRPRAQTSVRSPVPPPLNLKAAPSTNSNHRRRTMTLHVSSHSQGGSEAIPPVPSLRVPNTAPLVSTTPISHDRDTAAAAAVHSPDMTRPSFPNETTNYKASTGGMTPKRPSLLIRPSLRSPHRLGIRMAPFRSGETSLSPKGPAPFSPSVPSPTARGSAHTIQPSTNILHQSIEQAGYFSSPHASVGSSTGTASSSSTVPSPATPTSLRMTYNSRIPPVPTYHNSNSFSSGLKSPIICSHSDNPRYVMIDQTPKHSAGARGAPDTIKASRPYRPELMNSSPPSEPNEQVSYGMAL